MGLTSHRATVLGLGLWAACAEGAPTGAGICREAQLHVEQCGYRQVSINASDESGCPLALAERVVTTPCEVLDGPEWSRSDALLAWVSEDLAVNQVEEITLGVARAVMVRYAWGANIQVATNGCVVGVTRGDKLFDGVRLRTLTLRLDDATSSCSVQVINRNPAERATIYYLTTS